MRSELPPFSESSDRLSFDFPAPPGGAGAGPRPRAILSLAPAGSMRYSRDARNEARERFFRSMGKGDPEPLGIELAHSRNVIFPSSAAEHRVLEAEARREGGADGILLTDPSLVATITVADCMPIWLFDRPSGAFGVLHSGWKGTGILATAVEELARRYGSEPSGISVILGPAIGACCYDVPEERALAFREEFGPEAAALRDGRYFIDLRAANRTLARRLGLGAVLSVEACTSCDPRFGSYRRQGSERFTRMVAACGWF